MNRKYKVNAEKRKLLISEMRKKQRKKLFFNRCLINLGKIFILAIIIMAFKMFIPGFSECIVSRDYDELLIIFVALIPVVAILLFSAYGVMFIAAMGNKKYLRPWVSYRNEELLFHQKSLEWRHYNGYKGQGYWMLQMKYTDITRIEYDEDQKLLRIYGPYSGQELESYTDRRCLYSFDANTDAKSGEHFTINSYFDNFEELISQLEAKTGLKVVVKNNPLIFTKEYIHMV